MVRGKSFLISFLVFPGHQLTMQQFLEKLPQSVVKGGKLIDIRSSVGDSLQVYSGVKVIKIIFNSTEHEISTIVQYLTFGLGVKVAQDVTQYPLQHVTDAPAKFEVAIPSSLGVDAFTRKNNI